MMVDMCAGGSFGNIHYKCVSGLCFTHSRYILYASRYSYMQRDTVKEVTTSDRFMIRLHPLAHLVCELAQSQQFSWSSDTHP